MSSANCMQSQFLPVLDFFFFLFFCCFFFQQRNKHKQYILYYNIIITKKQAECYGILTHPIFFLVFVWGGGVSVCVRGGGQGERGTKDKNGVC